MNRYALVRVFAAMAASAFLMSATAGPAAADGNGNNSSLTFNRGVGVDPITCPPSPAVCAGSTGTVILNVVRGQQPGGQIWTINKLKATVNANGSIKVSGKGLVLAGGNGAGGIPATTPPFAVFATLSCLSSANFALSSTPVTGVTVSPTGDFQINDMLKPTPMFPCANPLLLIQGAANSHWFALGIVGSDDSND
jgi:hypothetical protein